MQNNLQRGHIFEGPDIVWGRAILASSFFLLQVVPTGGFKGEDSMVDGTMPGAVSLN